MSTLRFMLKLALACALLALLSLPLGNALPAFFMQGFVLCLLGSVALALADMARAIGRAASRLLTGKPT